MQVAIDLASSGFHVFPCHAGGEKAKAPLSPPIMSWSKQSTDDLAQVRRWWSTYPHAAIGLDLGKSRLIVIDCDRHDDNDGVHNFGNLVAENGCEWDFEVTVATPNQGTHIFFRLPDGVDHGNARGNLPAGIDVRGAGGYVIAPGTQMQDGRMYEVFGDIASSPMAPDWLMSIIKASKDDVQKTDTIANPQPMQTMQPTGSDEISDLLASISPDIGYNDWVAALMAVHEATGGSGAGLAIADAWSSRGSKYKRGEVARKWQSFKRSGIGLGTLASMARDHGADLSAIAIRHGKGAGDLDPAMLAIGADLARQLTQASDGTLHDVETGEVVEPVGVADRVASQADYPPGAVGSIARWIVATSRSPQPELAIAAALTLIGVASGRHIAGPTKAGTALYALCLSPTGSGKDHPLKQISRIMTAARMSLHIGPPEFISMSAVVNMLKRKPLCICPMDEFGDFMARVYNRRASPHERAIPKILRTMWSANFDQAATPEWASVQSEIINAPHISLFGVSTHEQFYSALEGGAAADGTLNRFMIIEGRKRVVEKEPDFDPHIVPQSIIEDMQRVFHRSGELAASMRNDVSSNPADAGMLTELPWCADGSESEWQAFRSKCKAEMEMNPAIADFWVRGAEMAIRIATIIAAGRHSDNIRIDDVQYGVQLAQRSIETMAEGASDYMAENENEASMQKILRIIKDRGIIKRRDLMRSIKSMTSRDLNNAIGYMVEAEMIERLEIKPDRGPSAISYRAI